MKLVILTFVYNDWPSVTSLLGALDPVLQSLAIDSTVIIMDDGSTSPPPEALVDRSSSSVRRAQIVRLSRNLGHQRAIAIGLCFICEKMDCDAVVVMDADGEDLPEDVPRLLDAMRDLSSSQVVFAERIRRSEGLRFRIFYQLYRLVHYILTGKGIRVGNFSVIPRSLLRGVVLDPNIWNHYAAAIVNSRVPQSTIPTSRGRRYHGISKLNFTNLVIHGLSAISCYADVIGVRVILGAIAIGASLALGILVIVTIRFATGWAIPGWATNAVGLLMIVLLQVLSLAVLFTLAVLGSRKGRTMIPLQDYHHWIDRSDDYK